MPVGDGASRSGECPNCCAVWHGRHRIHGESGGSPPVNHRASNDDPAPGGKSHGKKNAANKTPALITAIDGGTRTVETATGSSVTVTVTVTPQTTFGSRKTPSSSSALRSRDPNRRRRVAVGHDGHRHEDLDPEGCRAGRVEQPTDNGPVTATRSRPGGSPESGPGGTRATAAPPKQPAVRAHPAAVPSPWAIPGRQSSAPRPGSDEGLQHELHGVGHEVEVTAEAQRFERFGQGRLVRAIVFFSFVIRTRKTRTEGAGSEPAPIPSTPRDPPEAEGQGRPLP